MSNSGDLRNVFMGQPAFPPPMGYQHPSQPRGHVFAPSERGCTRQTVGVVYNSPPGIPCVPVNYGSLPYGIPPQQLPNWSPEWARDLIAPPPNMVVFQSQSIPQIAEPQVAQSSKFVNKKSVTERLENRNETMDIDTTTNKGECDMDLSLGDDDMVESNNKKPPIYGNKNPLPLPKSFELLLVGCESTEPWSTFIINPKTGSSVWSFEGSELSGQAVSEVVPVDGEYLLLPSCDKPLLHLISVHSKERQHVRSVLPGNVTSLAVNPESTVCCAAIEEKIYTWLLTTGHLLTIVAGHYQSISCLRFTSDGSMLISAGCDGLLQAWHLSDLITPHDAGLVKPEPLRKWTGHNSITGLHVSNGGLNARICTCSDDQTLKHYSISSGEILMTAIFDRPLKVCCMDNDETIVFVSTITGDIVQLNLYIQPAVRERHISTIGSGNCLMFKGHKNPVLSLSTNFDDSILVSGDQTGCIKMWHIVSRLVMLNVNGKGPVRTLKFISHWPSIRDENFKAKLPVRVFQKQLCETFPTDVPILSCEKPSLDLSSSQKHERLKSMYYALMKEKSELSAKYNDRVQKFHQHDIEIMKDRNNLFLRNESLVKENKVLKKGISDLSIEKDVMEKQLLQARTDLATNCELNRKVIKMAIQETDIIWKVKLRKLSKENKKLKSSLPGLVNSFKILHQEMSELSTLTSKFNQQFASHIGQVRQELVKNVQLSFGLYDEL